MGTCADIALQASPGDRLLGRWTVTGTARPLATGMLLPVREDREGRAGRARVHWPSLTGRATRRRLQAVAGFLETRPHPAIIPLLDWGEESGGTLVHVMAEAPGGALRSRGLPLPWRVAIEVVSVVGEALGAAHACGVLHRDVSPENILVGHAGAYWLGDWDSALLPDEQAGRDETAPMGTPGFMSPEQEAGDLLDPRSDVFSLGMTLRALVVGSSVLPDGLPTPERFARMTSGDFELPSRILPSCPPDVDQLVLRLTAPVPADRPLDGYEAAALAREILL